MGSDSDTESLKFVEETLSRLASVDPKLRTVVELRVFEGLTREEIAQRLGVSLRTAASYWAFARNWLDKDMAQSGQQPQRPPRGD